MRVEVNSEINFSHRFFFPDENENVYFIFMLTFLSTTLQFQNDYLELDKCDCYDLQIIDLHQAVQVNCKSICMS